jgi:hypothetical protein
MKEKRNVRKITADAVVICIETLTMTSRTALWNVCSLKSTSTSSDIFFRYKTINVKCLSSRLFMVPDAKHCFHSDVSK